MMVSAITRPAATLLRVATGLPSNYCRALTATGLLGLLRGYSWANVEWLLKQVQLETGRGSSKAIQQDNNAWGMSCVSVRPTNQVGCRELPDGNTLGKYASVEESVLDRFAWDDWKGLQGLKRSPAYPAEVNVQGYNPSGIYAYSVHSVSGQDARSVCYALGAVPVVGGLLALLIGRWRMK